MNEASIRPARSEDHSFVVDSMNEALAPYYGGDHTAHANRIFNTHLAGGRDELGHFSFEQRIFVLELEGRPAGLLNLVAKRQGTYKISPLIVAQAFRGRHGAGGRLLKHAEDYARSRDARQIYCTVAQQNTAALQFFLRKGYVRAGRSESHYKAGVTELMLYKLFLSAAFREELDRPNISVLPMEACHELQCRRLIEENVSQFFGGVDREWIDALFRGYDRRDSKDVNAKYKLLFVAVDRCGDVSGVVAATPKKGEPIKLMPFVASTFQAFTALLTDVPFLVKEYGHKVYLHIVPSVDQAIALQRQGWSLDAVMPAAYRDDCITQQWGYTLGEELMRRMRVKQGFFDQIRSGAKSLEVRVGYDNVRSIQPGERIQLMTFSDQQVIRVRDVRRYPTFERMLSVEDATKVVPGSKRAEVLALLRRIYPPDKEALGVVVLDIEPQLQSV